MTVCPDRRGFLRTAALTAVGGLAAAQSLRRSSVAAPAKPPLVRPLSPQGFKQNLAGPILSLPTTFNIGLSVNLSAVQQMVGRARRYDIPVFELTAGNTNSSNVRQR